MKLTVKFTDVYDGAEYPRTQTIDVPEPTDDLEDWADDNLRPLTGDGRQHDEAGYFAEITECLDRSDLVGHEFSWGV